MIGEASDGAGEDGERVGEGHGRRDAHADGVAGAAVDAEDDAAHARALALLHVPHLPGRVPLHPSRLSQPRTHTTKGPSLPTNCKPATQSVSATLLYIYMYVLGAPTYCVTLINVSSRRKGRGGRR